MFYKADCEGKQGPEAVTKGWGGIVQVFFCKSEEYYTRWFHDRFHLLTPHYDLRPFQPSTLIKQE
jgi:hypothetical protein